MGRTCCRDRHHGKFAALPVLDKTHRNMNILLETKGQHTTARPNPSRHEGPCVFPPAANDVMHASAILVNAILNGLLCDGGQRAQVGEARPQPAGTHMAAAPSQAWPSATSTESLPCSLTLHIAAGTSRCTTHQGGVRSWSSISCCLHQQLSGSTTPCICMKHVQVRCGVSTLRTGQRS
jgi:hypothetical protein